MGSGIKTLMTIMELTEAGALQPGAAICDLGVTQLSGEGADQAARNFHCYFAKRTPQAADPEKITDDHYKSIASGGYIGELLLLSGFQYTSLDIFNGFNTILFDLNIHTPGPKLKENFDLVLNLGTTEHIFNQLLSFQTIHGLTRLNGLIYHDLPVAGYVNHALFRYDPLFFSLLAKCNDYIVVKEKLSIIGSPKTIPEIDGILKYDAETVDNIGMEFIVKKRSNEYFKIPLEASTALAIDEGFYNVKDSENITLPSTTSVYYSGISDISTIRMPALTRYYFGRLKRALFRTK